jgi:predicted PurR-regulated permease PerM
MNQLFEKPFTFDRVIRIIFGIVILGVLIYILSILKNALLPFVIAWFLAYMAQPLVKFFQHRLRLKSRVLAITASLVAIVATVFIVYTIIAPSVSDEIENTMQLIKDSGGDKYKNIHMIPESWIKFVENNIDHDQIMKLTSRENIEKLIKAVAPKAWSLLSNTVSLLLSVTIVFVTFLYFIFILLDYEKIADGWSKLIPIKYRPFAQGLVSDLEFNMNRYFRGQALIALCVSVLFSVGFKIVGFPLAVVLGIFIGILNLIPYMQIIGLIPMLLLSLLKAAETGNNFWIIFGSGLLVLGVVQVIQDLYLTPKIMGKAMGLNPAIILLSLSIWGTLLGFIGLIIALPMTTLTLSYYKRFVLMETDDDKSK